MDRAEVIKALEEWSAELDKISGSHTWQYRKKVLAKTIAALREQDVTDINDGHKWISVKERLPEESGLVLAYDIGLGILVAYYHADMISSAWQSITHWMPLPEPPKEGAEG